MEAQPAAYDLLTVAEVAYALRVSKMTVYRLIHAGTLPAVKIGRSFRVPRQAYLDYLSQSAFDPALFSPD